MPETHLPTNIVLENRLQKLEAQNRALNTVVRELLRRCEGVTPQYYHEAMRELDKVGCKFDGK